jgi:hypothetical protein
LTDPLDTEAKRLRKLKPGVLCDEAGELKAAISDLQRRLDDYRAEAVRRELGEAEGALFRMVLTAPSVQQRLDKEKLEKVFGEDFIAIFSKEVRTDWQMRVYARKAGRSRGEDQPSEAA